MLFICELDNILFEYKSDKILDFYPKTSDVRIRLKDIEKTSKDLLRLLNDVDKKTEYLITASLEYDHKQNRDNFWYQTLENLRILTDSTKMANKEAVNLSNGRPKKHTFNLLICSIALAYEKYFNIKITKSRDGKFARVLRTIEVVLVDELHQITKTVTEFELKKITKKPRDLYGRKQELENILAIFILPDDLLPTIKSTI